MRLYKKRINVCHLISTFDVGGAEKLLVEFMKNSSNQEEINFSVIVMKDIIDKDLTNELKKYVKNVYILNKQDYKNPFTLLKLLKIIITDKIDVLHTHDGVKYWSILCKLAHPNLKLVFTSHENFDIKNLNLFKTLLHKVFIDNTIVISDPIQKSCQEKNIKQISVIYNGIDLSKFAVNRENKLNNSGELKIISVSSIKHRIKGQDILIKAVKICRDRGLNVHCSFVGGIVEGEKDSWNYLESLVNDLSVKNNISFLGKRNDVNKLLSESDLYIMASRTEAMPLALLEAMASGLPVISSDIPVAKTLIKSGENGILFKSEDYEDLAQKIQILYENRSKMNEIAKAGCEFVQDFDISNMANGYYNVYKNLVKS